VIWSVWIVFFIHQLHTVIPPNSLQLNHRFTNYVFNLNFSHHLFFIYSIYFQGRINAIWLDFTKLKLFMDFVVSIQKHGLSHKAWHIEFQLNFSKTAGINFDEIAYWEIFSAKWLLHWPWKFVEFLWPIFKDTLYKVTTSTQLREFKYNTGKTI